MSDKLCQKKPRVFESPFNSYREIEILGEGGSGRVFKAEGDDGTIYALKLLDPNRVSKEKVKRFHNELSFCSQNRHDNIVQVLDWGDVIIDDTKCPFYVMPFYSKTLRVLIEARIESSKVLPLFSQILNGVEAAHLQQVWHRDLKPENILYDESIDRIVIADFGIAHFAEEFLRTSIKTKTGARLANFQYAAPEQREQGKVDFRADIYALGMILNEMFTGILLQGTGYKTITSVAPEYSYLDAIVEMMVRQLPAERPQSIDEIKKELIGRKNEFISRQKLSELKQTVIPESELDDPLVRDPVQLVGIDYQNGKLVFNLSKRLNANWVNAFHSIGNYEYYHGYEPNHFEFRDNSTSVRIEEQFVQKMIDMFKDYIRKANENYKRMMLEQKRQKEMAERQALQQRIEEEERRQRVLRNARI